MGVHEEILKPAGRDAEEQAWAGSSQACRVRGYRGCRVVPDPMADAIVTRI